MIRVVLAVVLSLALVAVAVPAVDDAAKTRSERVGEHAALDIAKAASELATSEDAPPVDLDGPSRTVTVAFPSKSILSVRLSTFTVRRVSGGRSVLSVGVRGRPVRTVVVAVPIVSEENELVELSGRTGVQEFRLELCREPAGEVVVVLTVL
ncbi:DUF7311 family protein [Haloarchaeobius sp. DFWS5]|uniref:DUF7311 family protein n=1 Tax=Haloarchaeobius sp. DFWS5 TaxID=3446114 RepID=UPI003EBA594D